MSERDRVPAHYRVRSLEQAIGLLEFLEKTPEQGLPEIAAHLGVQVPNAHKLVVNLHAAGLIEMSPLTKRYRLGARRLSELTARALEGLNPWGAMRQSVPHLQQTTGMGGLMAVLIGGRAVYVEQFAGPDRALGRAFPAHATALGKALLAALPPTQEAALIAELTLDAWSERTITDPKALAADLATTRTRGYALEDGELDLRRRSVGIAVRDHTGTAVAAIGVGGFVTDLPDDRILEIVGAVSAEARRISEALGVGPLTELPSRRFEVEVTAAVEPPEAAPDPGLTARDRPASNARSKSRGA